MSTNTDWLMCLSIIYQSALAGESTEYVNNVAQEMVKLSADLDDALGEFWYDPLTFSWQWNNTYWRPAETELIMLFGDHLQVRQAALIFSVLCKGLTCGLLHVLNKILNYDLAKHLKWLIIKENCVCIKLKLDDSETKADTMLYLQFDPALVVINLDNFLVQVKNLVETDSIDSLLRATWHNGIKSKLILTEATRGEVAGRSLSDFYRNLIKDIFRS